MKLSCSNLLTALVFLTRIPIPAPAWRSASLGDSVAYFPLAGLAIGLILSAAVLAMGPILPPLALSAIILTLEFLLTGGLHLDGLMDAADGLLSGQPAEHALEIMRDSRVGSMGVIAGFLLLIMKFSLLASIQQQNLVLLLPVVLLVSRWNLSLAVTCFPAARAEGLGHAFVQQASRRRLLAAMIYVAVLTYIFLSWSGIALLAIGTLWAIIISHRICRKIGGLTGDTYGALAELTEAALLLLFVLFFDSGIVSGWWQVVSG